MFTKRVLSFFHLEVGEEWIFCWANSSNQLKLGVRCWRLWLLRNNLSLSALILVLNGYSANYKIVIRNSIFLLSESRLHDLVSFYSSLWRVCASTTVLLHKIFHLFYRIGLSRFNECATKEVISSFIHFSSIGDMINIWRITIFNKLIWNLLVFDYS